MPYIMVSSSSVFADTKNSPPSDRPAKVGPGRGKLVGFVTGSGPVMLGYYIIVFKKSRLNLCLSFPGQATG